MLNFSLWTFEVLITGIAILILATALQRVSLTIKLPSTYRYWNLKLAMILVLVAPLWSLSLPRDLRDHFGIGHFFSGSTLVHGRNVLPTTLFCALLLFSYLVGLSLFIYRMSRLIMGAKAIVAEAEPLDIEDSFYTVYSSKEVCAPVSLGLFDPKILLPGEFSKRLPDSEMRIVLAHEGIHIARHDHFFRGLSSLISLLWYFSPLKKSISDEFESEMELSCDSTLLTSGFFAPRQYGQLLVSIAEMHIEGNSRYGIAMSRSFLRRRLESLKYSQRPRLFIQLLMTFGLLTTAIGVSAFGIDTPSLNPPPQPFVTIGPDETCPDLQTCVYPSIGEGKSTHISCSSGLLNIVEAYYEDRTANLPCLDFAKSLCGGKSECDLTMARATCGADSNRLGGDAGLVKVTCSDTPGVEKMEFGGLCRSGFTCSYFAAHEHQIVNAKCTIGVLHIENATYGIGDQVRSCFEYVHSLCSGQRECSLIFTNGNCGGDPAFYKRKEGYMVATCY